MAAAMRMVSRSIMLFRTFHSPCLDLLMRNFSGKRPSLVPKGTLLPAVRPSSTYASGWTSISVSCWGASMRKPAGGSKVPDGRFRTWMFLTTVLVVINAIVTLSGEDVAGIRGLILELCSSGIPSFELSAESAGLRAFSREATSFWKFANSRAPGASCDRHWSTATSITSSLPIPRYSSQE